MCRTLVGSDISLESYNAVYCETVSSRWSLAVVSSSSSRWQSVVIHGYPGQPSWCLPIPLTHAHSGGPVVDQQQPQGPTVVLLGRPMLIGKVLNFTYKILYFLRRCM